MYWGLGRPRSFSASVKGSHDGLEILLSVLGQIVERVTINSSLLHISQLHRAAGALSALRL